jgi:hypothetical protein
MEEAMKIAVITPTTGSWQKLHACAKSVLEQQHDGLEVVHVVVWDGSEMAPSVCDPPIEQHHISLPRRAGNAGATPRAIGSVYARDIITFLDDDNEFAPSHLANAVQFVTAGAEVITSARMLCHYDTGNPFSVDRESNGDDFADTNTIVLAGRAAKFGATWDWPAPYELRCPPSGADRIFWDRLKKSFGDRRAHTEAPTVLYRTPWVGVLDHGVPRNCHYPRDVVPPRAGKVRVFEAGKQPRAIPVRSSWREEQDDWREGHSRFWMPATWIEEESRWDWEEIIGDDKGRALRALSERASISHKRERKAKDLVTKKVTAVSGPEGAWQVVLDDEAKEVNGD